MSAFKKELFQHTLSIIINGDTNSAFAEKVGISRVYLQKLLSKNANAPSKHVTMQIAKQANDPAVANQIIEACGYSDALTEHDRRALMDPGEWAEANAEDVKAFFGEYAFTRPFDKREFLDVFHGLYADTRAFISFGDVEDYKGDQRDAEKVMSVKFIWHNRKYKVQQILLGALFGHCSEGGKLYITEKALAVADLVDAFPRWKKQFENMSDAFHEIGNIFEEPRFYVMKEYTPFEFRGEPKTTEERLLKAIFGERGDGEKHIISWYGYGFYLDDEPERFIEFLRKHRNAFEEDSSGAEFCRKVLDDGCDPIEQYNIYDGCIFGASAIIATIMELETGIPFCGWVHENEDDRNRNCVMLERNDHAKGGYDDELVKETVEKYARELHLPQIETVVFYTHENANQLHMKEKELEYDG